MLPQAMEMANTMPSVWMRCSFSPDGTFGVMLKCLPRWVGRWVTQQHCRPGRFVGGVGAGWCTMLDQGNDASPSWTNIEGG